MGLETGYDLQSLAVILAIQGGSEGYPEGGTAVGPHIQQLWEHLHEIEIGESTQVGFQLS